MSKELMVLRTNDSRILPPGSCGYYNFHVENGVASNQDIYARKILMCFQRFTMWRLSEDGDLLLTSKIW